MYGAETPFPAEVAHRSRTGSVPRTFRDVDHNSAEHLPDPGKNVPRQPGVGGSAANVEVIVILYDGSSVGGDRGGVVE